MLSSAEIRRAVEQGEVGLQPFEEACLRPSSYLLRLGTKVLVEKSGVEVVDVHQTDTAEFFEPREIASEGILIERDRLYLACSVERISLNPSIAGQLSLLTSFGRLGLHVNLSSHLVSATFGSGDPSALTFELMNVSRRPIRLYAMAQFCHLSFFRHGIAADLRYAGIYAGADGPIPANFRKRPSR